jgi:hypothetical protein
MHERKKLMFTNCNAIVTLPGGVGSLDEFFEILTWTQLEISTKPLYLLNIDGYWDLVIQLIDQMVNQGFAEGSLLNKFTIINSVAALETNLLNLFS